MKIGYLGLGKMGYNMVQRLKEKGHTVIAYDPDEEARAKTEALGIKTVTSLSELISKLETPRLIWSMIPHGAIDDTLNELTPLLEKGDIFMEAANSQYELSMRRAKELTEKGLRFMDVGVSGGPGGARNGACLMIGGQKVDFEEYKNLFKDVAKDEGYYALLGDYGAGHYAKMIHNGIEYGMMQAIGEGAALLKDGPHPYNLVDVFDIYDHGSVIESRLVAWAREGFRAQGPELSEISPSIGHTGEGEWTVKEAQRQGIATPIIEGSFKYRVESKEHPSFVGRVVNMLRNQFGGHAVQEPRKEFIEQREGKRT